MGEGTNKGRGREIDRREDERGRGGDRGRADRTGGGGREGKREVGHDLRGKGKGRREISPPRSFLKVDVYVLHWFTKIHVKKAQFYLMVP